MTDGCLIDLCGMTLMWRTALGLDHGPVSLLALIRGRSLILSSNPIILISPLEHNMSMLRKCRYWFEDKRF